MGEEFQGAVCGGNWWNSSRSLLGSSPCLISINDMCSFDMLSTRSTDDLVGSSTYTSCVPLQDTLSSNNQNWNHDLINSNGKSEENYSVLNPGMNFCEDFQTNNSLNNQDFPIEQESMNNNSSQCPGFPLNSPAYGYNPSLLQTLFDTDSQPQLLDHNQSMNYSSAENCAMVQDFLPVLPKASPNHLKFTNDTPFWNAKANVRPPMFPPSSCADPQFIPPSIDNSKLNISNFTRKHQSEETGKMAKKSMNEPVMKRVRIETPSPLPTFKVRKEKLGDRVTALQQLVSPFGKTDTASVLHEAIEYIKFLHDQVSVLSTPYLKNGSTPTPGKCQGQATDHKTKPKDQDLRSRGLCLVPITSTFPVATESSSDFWAPAFGGSFR